MQPPEQPTEPAKPRPIGARNLRPFRKKKKNRTSSTEKTRHGYVRSFDGTKLFYSVEGEGQPLVFCYGLVCSSLHWTYQIDYFRKNYQTIWFDYRGHQNSETPADLSSLTVDALSRDTLAIMDEIGVKEAVFLGHSMGVNVVLDFYHRFPERVRGMVLANGTPKRPLETLFANPLANNLLDQAFGWAFELYRRAPKLATRLWRLQQHNPLSQSFLGLAGFNPHLTPRADIVQYAEEVAAMDPGILFYLIENYNAYNALPWLHEINVPTLLIGGERDWITPIAQQELMHQLIPGSELVRIPHGSHCAQLDLPDLVNLQIEKFLKKARY